MNTCGGLGGGLGDALDGLGNGLNSGWTGFGGEGTGIGVGIGAGVGVGIGVGVGMGVGVGDGTGVGVGLGVGVGAGTGVGVGTGAVVPPLGKGTNPGNEPPGVRGACADTAAVHASRRAVRNAPRAMAQRCRLTSSAGMGLRFLRRDEVQ